MDCPSNRPWRLISRNSIVRTLIAARKVRLPAPLSFGLQYFRRWPFKRVDFFSLAIIARRVLCYEDVNKAVFPPYGGAKEEGVKRTINAMTI